MVKGYVRFMYLQRGLGLRWKYLTCLFLQQDKLNANGLAPVQDFLKAQLLFTGP